MKNINNLIIRNVKPSDHEKVVSVIPQWWNGRDLSSTALKIFFVHFNDTSFIAEISGELAGFLIGFMSQSEKNVGYAHLGGVHPEYRKAGIARLLLHEFIQACKINNRSVVKSCTAPVNKLSIDFHKQMGFTIEQGDGTIEGVPVTLDYLGKNNHKVLFKKEIE